MQITIAEDAPLSDVRGLIRSMPAADRSYGELAMKALIDRYGRADEFGRLGTMARWLATWQRRYPPRIEAPVVSIFAGAHGLVSSGVSVSTQDGIRDRISALRDGRMALNALAAQQDATIRVFELATETPTPNIAEAPAMTNKACAATIAFGFEALAENPDCLALGVMGAGVGTAAAAVACALYGGDPSYWVRPGPNTPVEIARKRAELVGAALKIHRGVTDEPLRALAALGGRELAACVGAIIAARHQGVPVVLDGFATCVAAGVVKALRDDGIEHCIAANQTLRPAHEAILERIGLKPVLDIGMTAGGGMGSTMALGMLRAATALHIARAEGAAG